MRSSNAWAMKLWQRSEWRLGFNSVFLVTFDSFYDRESILVDFMIIFCV